MSAALPHDVERFLREHVDSIAQLEILVLLQARATVDLTAGAVARELGIDAGWTSAELESLVGRGLVRGCGEAASRAFRFAPASEEARATIDRVVHAYRERRVTVVDLIATKPSRHVLGFADAFRLRKD